MGKVVCKMQEDCLKADINPELCIICENNTEWTCERVDKVKQEIKNCLETVEKLAKLLNDNEQLPTGFIETSKSKVDKLQNEIGIFDRNKK